jgi:hypothetical protein
MSTLISKCSLAAALALSSLAHDADAFSAASPMARMKASSFSSGFASPAGTMSLAMSARDGSSSINSSSNNALGRRSLLRHAGSFAAAVAVQVQGSPAFAKVGDFAKQDFSGSGGDSQSGVRNSFQTVSPSSLDGNHLALCRASLIHAVEWCGVEWHKVWLIRRAG